MFNSRIYYRNTFLHIGHLQTLCHNNDFAKANNGRCYAIIDDRQDPHRSLQIKEDLEYLQLNDIHVISVVDHQIPIQLYTRELIESGVIYIPGLSPSQTLEYMTNPRSNFQIRLNYGDQPTVGYSKQLDNGPYIVIYIFDYIIKVLDALLNVTDVVTTTATDVSDTDIMNFFTIRNPLNYHKLTTYKIVGFRYSKKDWPLLPEDDPRLMTIRGMKARHIPAEVIYSFYLHASALQKHDSHVKVTFFDKLLKMHLSLIANRVFGVIDPLEVNLINMKDCCTEFIFKPYHPIMADASFNIVPLSKTMYIDRSDFGLIDYGDKISKDKEVRLRHSGGVIYCTSVEMNTHGHPIKLDAKYSQKTESTPASASKSIHWISSIAGSLPIPARFFLYNWFFTGENPPNSYEPLIRDGFIDERVFKDTTQIYQLERHGYFKYDDVLSAKHSIPCFIKITGYR